MRRPLPVTAVVLALAACSAGDPDPTPPAAAPSASDTATPASAAPTSDAPSAAPSAPAVTTPPSRGPARDGDVDGDGRVDAVTATQELLTVRTAAGTLTAPVVADAEPPVQGVVDVDRDGRAEVFLETTRGASTVFYTPFRYDGATLAALQLEGEPVRLGVGGSITHGDGFACEGGRLVVSTSTSEDGETFAVTTTTYAVRGHVLERVSRAAAQGLRQGDPRVAASYQVSCGSVTQDG